MATDDGRKKRDGKRQRSDSRSSDSAVGGACTIHGDIHLCGKSGLGPRGTLSDGVTKRNAGPALEKHRACSPLSEACRTKTVRYSS